MARVRVAPTSRARRKRILKQAKGFRGGQSKLIRTATEKVMRALNYAYRDRRVKKREFRALWITRIGNACRQHGLNYSRFIAGLNNAHIEINRKNLADLAVRSPEAFKALVDQVKGAYQQDRCLDDSPRGLSAGPVVL